MYRSRVASMKEAEKKFGKLPATTTATTSSSSSTLKLTKAAADRTDSSSPAPRAALTPDTAPANRGTRAIPVVAASVNLSQLQNSVNSSFMQ